jgi:DNA-binding NarL/FixJ family response regulator/nucleoside-triphosphatase THEP1
MFGRTHELHRIDEFLTSPWPLHLAITGEAGIGKSTLLRSTIERCRGRGTGVISVSATPNRARLPLAGLLDIIDHPLLATARSQLPFGRRAALDDAAGLGRAEVVTPTTSVALALTEMLQNTSRHGPVLVAIDDLQWFDVDSQAILEEAVRRLGASDPIGIVTTSRSNDDGVITFPGVERNRLDVGPLTRAGIVRLLRERAGGGLTDAERASFAERARGNPQIALELAAAATADGGFDVPLGHERAVLARLGALGDSTQRLVQFVAVTGRLDERTASVVSGPEALAGALHSGLLRLRRGALECDHPLTAEVVLAHLPSTTRRELHDVLAAVSDGDQRIIHAGLATDGVDPKLAGEHAELAERAAARGAPLAASELAGRAAALSPNEVDRVLRTARAARFALRAGASTIARSLVDAVDDERLGSAQRAELALVRCDIDMAADDRERAVAWAEAALRLAEAEADRGLAARSHAAIAQSSPYSVDTEVAHARIALELLDGDERQHASIACQAHLSVIYAQLTAGDGLDDHRATRALELEPFAADLRLIDGPSVSLATMQSTAGRADEARRALRDGIERSQQLGDETSSAMLRAHLVVVEIFAGRFPAALALLAETRQSAEVTDEVLWGLEAYQVWLGALTSDDDPELVATAIRADEGSWASIHRDRAHAVSLMVHGRWREAAVVANRAISTQTEYGIAEPSYFRIAADVVDALGALGDDDHLAEAHRPIAAAAGSGGLPWTVMVDHRARSHLSRLAGDIGSAVDHAESATAIAEGLSDYEFARTSLSLASLHRTAGNRRVAREAAGRAAAAFDAIGASRWAEVARIEAARIGGRRSVAPGALTDSEWLVASLAAEGCSNRDIAAKLLVTVRTVESHLSAVYRKLGVRSRTSLVHALAGAQADPARGSAVRASRTS